MTGEPERGTQRNTTHLNPNVLPEGEMDDAAAARMRINRGRDEVPATVAQRVQKASDAPAYSGS